MAARWANLMVLAVAASLVLVAGPGHAQYFSNTGNEIEPPKEKGLRFNQTPVLQPRGDGIKLPSESKALMHTPQPVLEVRGDGIKLPEEKQSLPEIPQKPILKGSGNEIGVQRNDELSPLIKDALNGLETAKNSAVQELSPLLPQAPVYLKAKMVHSEKLDAVPDGFRAGNPINIKDLESLPSNNYWRKIPKE